MTGCAFSGHSTSASVFFGGLQASSRRTLLQGSLRLTEVSCYQNVERHSTSAHFSGSGAERETSGTKSCVQAACYPENPGSFVLHGNLVAAALDTWTTSGGQAHMRWEPRERFVRRDRKERPQAANSTSVLRLLLGATRSSLMDLIRSIHGTIQF